MSVVAFYSDVDADGPWRKALVALDPDIEFRAWPEWGDYRDIDFVLVWRPPPRLLKQLPALRAIFSLGAGVDHLLGDPDLPAGVPVIRMVDPFLTRGMSEYVVMQVLYHHRRMFEYRRQQEERQWRELPQVPAHRRRVGVMGAGVLGSAVLEHLHAFGFDLAAWTRSRRHDARYRSFADTGELESFLGRTDILVVLLPCTPLTRNLLNHRTLGCLPRGASLINAGRGQLVEEQDLLDLLAADHLYGASLDVCEHEPLPADHPFWGHPRVFLTPHIASVTAPASAAAVIVDNIHRSRAGQPLRHTVDPGRGY